MLIGAYHCFIVFIEHPVELEFLEEFVTLASISSEGFRWSAIPLSIGWGGGVVEQLVLVLLLLEAVLLQVAEVQVVEGEGVVVAVVAVAAAERWP